MAEIVPWPCGRACKLTEWRYPPECMSRFQHGDNPEHSRDFPDYELASGDFVLTQPPGGRQMLVAKPVIDWLATIHSKHE